MVEKLVSTTVISGTITIGNSGWGCRWEALGYTLGGKADDYNNDIRSNEHLRSAVKLNND